MSLTDISPARRDRRDELRQSYQDAHIERVDCVMARLLAAQWIAAVVGALWVSPVAWAGTGVDSSVQAVVAIIVSSLVAAVAGVLVWQRPCEQVTRHAIAAAQIIFSCLLIHLTAGRGPMHFHLFGSLAFLALYRDWRILMTAAAVITIDHIVRGACFPQSIYGTTTPGYFGWIEHLAWVGFECGFLFLACRFSERDVRELADLSETGEHTIELIGDEVRARTSDVLRESDQVRAASAAHGRFLANVSSTIRAPMNGLDQLAADVLRGELEPQQRARVELLQTTSAALTAALADFHVMAGLRPDNEPASRSVAIRRLVSDAVQLCSLATGERSTELSCAVDCDVPMTILGDEAWLRHILTTSLANIMGATEGDVRLTVTARLSNAKELDLVFLIAEHDRHVQSDADGVDWSDDTTPRNDLVPAVVRDLIGRLGGQVRQTSRLGERTAVEISVRCLAASDAADGTTRGGELAGKRVLIVDDSSANLRLLSDLVSQCGLVPLTAQDSFEAMRQLVESHERCEAIAFVLLDAHMPDTDTLELAAEIHKLRQSGRVDAETVLMSSLSGDLPEDLRQAGVAACLLKPLSQDRLLSTLDHATKHVVGSGPEEEVPDTTTAEKPRYHRRPDSGLRILLAEDNLVNQQLMLRVLEREGHSVVLADNGREACSLAASEQTDIALFDAEMPEMDGREAVAVIRESEGDEHSMPVIGLVARNDPDDASVCIDAGMDATISKPVQIDELLHVMAVLMERGSRFAGERRVRRVRPAEEDGDGVPVLDRAQLLQRVGGDPQFLDLLAVMLREDCPQRLVQIQEGLAADDFSLVRTAAHAIQGTTANVGAVRATAEAVRLQELADQKRRDECVVSAIELDRILKQVFGHLDELIIELQADVVL